MMQINQIQNRKKVRTVLLVIGLLGLLFSASVFILSKISHRNVAETIRPTTPSTQVPLEKDRAKILQVVFDKLDTNDLPVAEPPTTTPEPKRERSGNRFRHARNKVAIAFPAPPNLERNNSLDLTGPKAPVEMWSGTNKKVVFVPPGPKYED